MQHALGISCWEEGYNAYYLGYNYNENPYWQFGVYDQRYIDWAAGMEQAFHDECFIMTPIDYF